MITAEVPDQIIERARDEGVKFGCWICGADIDYADVRMVRDGPLTSYVCPGHRGDN